MPSKLYPKFSGLCEIFEIRGPTLNLRKLDTDKVFTASHDALRASTLSQPEVPLQVEPLADLPSTQNTDSSAKDLEVGRIENPRLFADDEWLPFSASQILSLTVLDFTPPPLSVLHCRSRNLLLALSVMSDFLHVSRLQSRLTPHTVTVGSRAVITAAHTCI